MKIGVSFLKSIYPRKKTIDKINESRADSLHADLTDGIYAGVSNYTIPELTLLFKDNTKPLELHLMIDKPSKLLDKFIELKPDAIYLHPSTDENIFNILDKLKTNGIKRGIAINPDEDIKKFEKYFDCTDKVLLMSVVPGEGGQSFLPDTKARLNELKTYQEKYHFEIIVDGGINDETVKLVWEADGVVSGSFICMKDDFDEQLKRLN